MTASQKPEPNPCGSEAWELFYEVMKASKPHLEAVAATLDLSPQQMWALRQLANERPLPMSALAGSLGCDASNVTAIVDKLEARGLVQRRSTEHDRRVKELVMTQAGVEVRNLIAERMRLAPPAIANLSVADQNTLCTIFRRALASLSF